MEGRFASFMSNISDMDRKAVGVMEDHLKRGHSLTINTAGQIIYHQTNKAASYDELCSEVGMGGRKPFLQMVPLRMKPFEGNQMWCDENGLYDEQLPPNMRATTLLIHQLCGEILVGNIVISPVVVEEAS